MRVWLWIDGGVAGGRSVAVMGEWLGQIGAWLGMGGMTVDE